jgi:hypothetical protein
MPFWKDHRVLKSVTVGNVDAFRLVTRATRVEGASLREAEPSASV